MMANVGFNSGFLGYTDTMVRETEQSLDSLKRKLEAEAKAAARQAEEAQEQAKSTNIFSPTQGSDRSAAGAWADSSLSGLSFTL